MSHGQSYIYKELHGSPESMDTRTPFCGVHYAGTLTKQIPNKTLYIIYMEQSCDAATWNNFAPVFSSPPPPPPLGSHRSNHLHPPTSLPSWGGGRFKSQNVQFHSLTLKKARSHISDDCGHLLLHGEHSDLAPPLELRGRLLGSTENGGYSRWRMAHRWVAPNTWVVRACGHLAYHSLWLGWLSPARCSKKGAVLFYFFLC